MKNVYRFILISLLCLAGFPAFPQDSGIPRWKEALAECDSLIGLIESGKTPKGSEPLQPYKDRAYLLKKLRRFTESCEAYKRATAVSDSLIKGEYLQRVGALRKKHDVNALLLEKTNLQAKNRHIAFLFSLGLLLIATGMSFYYYQALQKTKKLQTDILRQSKIAQESEQMKSAFINSICHEIRTPLNAINGFSDILTDDSSTQEEKKEYQQIIQQNTHLLATLLNSLIEVANLNSFTDNLPLEETDLLPYCRNEMEYLQLTEGKASIDYSLDLPNESCLADIHPQYFSLLIYSLLSNANKFTQEGRICLKCETDTSQGCIIVSITDTGQGIPPEKYEYVFQRFTKLDTFTHGNGLGLYLSRLIAKHMHGEVNIDPNYRDGARFLFTLPLKHS